MLNLFSASQMFPPVHSQNEINDTNKVRHQIRASLEMQLHLRLDDDQPEDSPACPDRSASSQLEDRNTCF